MAKPTKLRHSTAIDSRSARLVPGLVVFFALYSILWAVDDVGSVYQIDKQALFAQSGSSNPVAQANAPYAFESKIAGGTVGNILPSSSLTPGTAVFSSDGTNGVQFYQEFTSKMDLDNAFPDTFYIVTISTSVPNTYQGPLILGPDNYPATIPRITNTTWAMGSLLIDPNQDFTLTWNSFAGQSIIVEIDAAGTRNAVISQIFENTAGTETSFTIPAHTLQPGVAYTGRLSFASDAYAPDTTAIPGSTALSLFANKTNFPVLTKSVNIGGNDPSAPILAGSGSSPTAYQNIFFSGNVYDVVLLNGSSVTVYAETGHITRVPFIDPNDNICFVEFGGAGSVSVAIPNPVVGPPVNYQQPTLNYAKGLATVTVNNADLTSYLSIYSLGSDPTRVDPTLIVNASAIDGIAHIQSLTVNGAAIGGLNLANAQMSGTDGIVGIMAPLVSQIGGNTPGAGTAYVGNINAGGAATPDLLFASGASLSIVVVGGNMLQANGQPLQCAGLGGIYFVPGVTATAVSLPKGVNAGVFMQNGQNVTGQIVH